ncbi:MAG TPA: rod shape-determining protein MreC [Gammaproteobacteria bacterium]|nr:rod shape-determining protein MreC [Gammaproteobacteria bacterium]
MPDFKHHRASYSLFAYKPAAGAKVLFFIVLSVVLMTLDHQYHNLEVIRSGLSATVYPLRYVAALPYKIGSEIAEDLSFRSTLLKRNAELEREALILRARLQQFDTIKRENTHLRALMDAAARTQGKIRIGEIMAVDLDPFRQQVVINRGTNDGAYVGQPLLGAKGVMGQITHVSPFSATALLITDPNTAIPVENARNGLRTIAIGTGDTSLLQLPYLPNNADIKPGDALVTSGLGGRFPRGYPVGTVTEVVQKPGAPFAEVEATPAAELSRSHQVLLLWPPEPRHPVDTAALAKPAAATP